MMRWTAAVRLHRPLLTIAALTAVTAVACAAGLLLDDRQLAGEPVWAKPLRFAVSITVYAVTLAWLLSALPRQGRAVRWAGAVAAVTLGLEQGLIVVQAARGRHSHFNVATSFDTTVLAVMAGTIGVLWLATLVIAVALLRARIADRPLVLALRFGIIISLGGMLVGVLMVFPTADQVRALDAGTGGLSGAHTVGRPDGGPGLPITGWSTVAGDLRVGHFVGIHALQALPLLAAGLALLARRRPALTARRRARLVAVGAGLYAAVTVLVTWQALRGQSVVHPDARTAGVAAATATVAVAAALLALRMPTPSGTPTAVATPGVARPPVARRPAAGSDVGRDPVASRACGCDPASSAP